MSDILHDMDSAMLEKYWPASEETVEGHGRVRGNLLILTAHSLYIGYVQYDGRGEVVPESVLFAVRER